jgi:cell division protein FtsL
MSYQRTTTQFSSRRVSNWNRNQNTTRFASNVKLGPVTHTVLVALMITVLGLIYLTQATRATSYDYEAQAIDTKISDLATQKTDLEVEDARLTALENVQNSSVAREMTAPAQTDYVSE